MPSGFFLEGGRMSDKFQAFLCYLGDQKMFHYWHLRFLRNLIILGTRILIKMLSSSSLLIKLQDSETLC